MAKRKAVALKYDRQTERHGAPLVVAKGGGLIAQKIIEIAKENGIEIVEDPDLVEVLAKVEIGTEIPSELYESVARILAEVYKINARKNSKDSAGNSL